METGDGKDCAVFAIAQVGMIERPDVAQKTGGSHYLNCGWSKMITPSTIHPGATIRAWAFDTQSAQAFKLAGSFKVPEYSP